ncbi:MAG: helix-turn-helix domain-containing protein, partial [Thermomicrobiales bacterium]
MALDDRGYYNVSQAAALLGVSRVSIWRWIRDGHLPAVRLGQRTTRIKRDDLERALSQITATGSRSWVTRNKAATPETGCASLEPSDRGKWGASEHVVQFYEKDAFLEAAVADYIGAALRGGDAGIVISTRTHLENIEADLR